MNPSWRHNSAKLAEQFTAIGQTKFRFLASYHYAWDLTNHDIELDPSANESTLTPAAKYLRDSDVLALMDSSYLAPLFSRHLQDDTLADGYFGAEHPTARDLILHAPLPNELQ